MKQLIIEGNFEGANNLAIVDVFRPNGDSNPYDFRKVFKHSFREILIDLQPDTTYIIDVTGYTMGSFHLTIRGEIEQPNPIGTTFTDTDFSVGYAFHTEK